MGNWDFIDLIKYQDQGENEGKKPRGVNPDEVVNDSTLPQPKVVKPAQTTASAPTDWADLLPKPDMSRETKIAQSRLIGGLFGDIARGMGNIAMTKGKNGGWMPTKDNGVTERAINILSDTEAKNAAAMRDYAARRSAATMQQRLTQMNQQTELEKAEMARQNKKDENATKVEIAKISADASKHRADISADASKYRADITANEGQLNRDLRKEIADAERANRMAIAEMQHGNSAKKNSVTLTLVDNPTNESETLTTRSVSFANKTAIDGAAGAVWQHIVRTKYKGNDSSANDEFANFIRSKAETDPEYAEFAGLLGGGGASANKTPEAIILWASSLGDKGVNDFIEAAAKGKKDDSVMPLLENDDDDNTMPT